MHPKLRTAADSPVFAVTAAPYLLLDTDLKIRAVNPSYARATMRDPEELVGEFMFDAFPDNPEDPEANGVARLSLSFEQVLSSGRAHAMQLQRYDIPVGEAYGGSPRGFAAKTWAPVNSPVIADDAVVGVLHHVEDVTDAHRTFSAADPSLRDLFTPGLRHALRVVHDASRPAPLTPAPPRETAGKSLLLSYRDSVWHQLVHAARRAPSKSCADVICGVVTHLLPGIEGVAITLYTPTRSVLHVAATNKWTRHVEELQVVTGEGPGPTALASSEAPVTTIPAPTDARWPVYAEAAGRNGVTAAAAYPLRGAAAATFGTMTFYCRTTSQRLPSQIRAATLAEVAAAVLIEDVDARAIAQLSTTSGFDDISIAVGILASSRGISTSDAEAQLRAAAYASDQSLPDLARQIIARRHVRGDDLT